MFFDGTRNVLITFVMLAFILPLFIGASCPGRDMGIIRDAHAGIRDAFVRVDEFTAPRFEVAGDECIAQAQTAGLEGQAGVDASDECMSMWLELDRIVSVAREIMVELEEVYDDIESGGDNDWQHIVRRVLVHGRAVIRLLDEIDIEGVDEVISSMREAIDRVCGIVNCERSAL